MIQESMRLKYEPSSGEAWVPGDAPLPLPERLVVPGGEGVLPQRGRVLLGGHEEDPVPRWCLPPHLPPPSSLSLTHSQPVPAPHPSTLDLHPTPSSTLPCCPPASLPGACLPATEKGSYPGEGPCSTGDKKTLCPDGASPPSFLPPSILHPTPHTWHLAPYTFHPSLYTPHLPPYTLHPSPCTPHLPPW